MLEMIGEGSFGKVYKGRRRFTAEVVALKFIPRTGRSEKEVRALQREIDIMRELVHPNIVHMHESFETAGQVRQGCIGRSALEHRSRVLSAPPPFPAGYGQLH